MVFSKVEVEHCVMSITLLAMVEAPFFWLDPGSLAEDYAMFLARELSMIWVLGLKSELARSLEGILGIFLVQELTKLLRSLSLLPPTVLLRLIMMMKLFGQLQVQANLTSNQL